MSCPAELYACLYAKEFPAQAALRLRPELRDEPTVVVEGEPPLELVCSLNAKARRRGVERGMTRVELDTFPAVVVLSRSQPDEVMARSVLLECASGFTPRVEDCSDGRSFLCVLDIAGTEKLLGPPRALAQELLRRVLIRGVSASVAISSNFHAAMSYARGSSSRIAMIEAGNESSALSSLPLKVLDLSRAHADTFDLWGVRTLGGLAALPEDELVARMGQEGRRLRQLARGQSAHHFVPLESDFVLKERMELDTPVELLESLLFVVGVMLEQLSLRATERVLALASVTITLTLEGGGVYARTVRTALPTNDRQLWIKLLHLDLEAHPPAAAILAVELAAEPGSTSKVQLGLFSPQLPEPMRLDITLARIRALVGESCVGRPVLQDTHRLDGFRMEAFTVPTERGAAAGVADPVAAMRQLRPPDKVAVTLNGQQPAALTFRGSEYEVEQAYGPWIAGGSWWSPESWALEQWDVIARSCEGAMLCCCLVRDLRQQVWQVVTLYD